MSDQPLSLRPPQRFAQALRRHGVEFLFGQSNPPGLTLACNDIGIRQVGYRQENAGSYMADGYARVTGRVPVVTAQNGARGHAAGAGPGGVPVGLGAHRGAGAGRRPRRARPQRVPGARSGGAVQGRGQVDPPRHQRQPHRGLRGHGLRRRGQRAPRPRGAAGVDGAAGRARGAGPSSRRARPRWATIRSDRVQPDPAIVAAAAKLLAEARAPIVYAGGGVIGSGAQAELRALQERAHLPVATTTMGKGGVDETHPLVHRRHRLLHGHARHGQVRPAAGDQRGRRAAGGQPHQPERHRFVDAAAARRHVHPHRHRRDRDRPQLRIAAPQGRREADAAGAERGARHAGPDAAPRRARAAGGHAGRVARTAPRRDRRGDAVGRVADPARALHGRTGEAARARPHRRRRRELLVDLGRQLPGRHARPPLHHAARPGRPRLGLPHGDGRAHRAAPPARGVHRRRRRPSATYGPSWRPRADWASAWWWR